MADKTHIWLPDTKFEVGLDLFLWLQAALITTTRELLIFFSDIVAAMHHISSLSIVNPGLVGCPEGGGCR